MRIVSLKDEDAIKVARAFEHLTGEDLTNEFILKLMLLRADAIDVLGGDAIATRVVDGMLECNNHHETCRTFATLKLLTMTQDFKLRLQGLNDWSEEIDGILDGLSGDEDI